MGWAGAAKESDRVHSLGRDQELGEVTDHP